MELTLKQKKEIDKFNQETLEKIPTVFGLSVLPVAGLGLLPTNLNELKIKQKEAQRMFPGADPNMFNYERGGVLAGKSLVPTIPLSQSIGLSRVFDKQVNNNNLYRNKTFYPEYLPSQPNTPSQELGSFQTLLQNKPPSSEGSLQAVTVTPGPGPSRFSADSLTSVDKLGVFLNQYEQQKKNWLNEKGEAPSRELQEQIATLKKEYIPQAGQVWGNINKPQYGYAQRENPQTGEFIRTANPSLYISRFEASPFKQADYLYTGDVEEDPRVKLKAFESEGKTTGPSWGIRSESSRSGRADSDVNFRKDLIEARGELTTGDIQALLKAKGLPFDYQSTKLTKDSGAILSNNLNRLAESENLTPYQVIEKYARNVPAIGEPRIPSTPAVTSKISEFPVQGQGISPFGSFASKVDLRQLGILPPSDKASYTAFKVDEFDKLFKYEYPRYNASNIQQLNTYTTPINPLDPFGEAEEGLSELIINRDKLRPQAANKLLDRTVNNLIKQSVPIKSLGLGGIATGSIATIADPAVIDALAKGNYKTALKTAAINTGIGAVVGSGIQAGLSSLQAAGYARPAAAIGSVLPAAGGVLAGLGAVETGKALNRVYRAQTGKDWITRNEPVTPYSTYTGPTPTIEPRIGTAILGGKPVQVPYGSVAGEKKVGRPWWDKAGSRIQKFADLLNAGSVIGR